MEYISKELQKAKLEKYKEMREKKATWKDVYKWLKDNGICVSCKCKIARKNKTRCGPCAYNEKIYVEAHRNYTKKNITFKAKY